MASIRLTDLFRRLGTIDGREHVVISGGVGYLRIERHGTGSYHNGILSDVDMEATADVQVGPNLNFSPPMKMTALQLRDLGGLLIQAADWLDEGVRVPDPPTLLVHHPDTGDVYYTGDLDAGKWMVQRHRYSKMDLGEDGRIHISLCDDEDRNDVAEWGSGKTEEEAWRYAIGAACGPLDSEYDERHLINLLSQYEPPVVDEPGESHYTGIPASGYKTTHASVKDGSTAMLLTDDGNGFITLVNEDGYSWTDMRSEWRPIKEEAVDRYCATCDKDVPDDDTHPAEWHCANPECGIWFHVGGGYRCPRCNSLPED